ncbi:MAG TPA: hypothetical protein VF469_40920 [Kofleriaceae bacterium]
MNKLLAALLVSASLLSCGGKKEGTTPVNKDTAPLERKDDAIGGATYGGKAAGGPAGGASNPCAPR